MDLSPPATLIAAVFVLAPGIGLVMLCFPSGRAALPTQVALVVPFGFASVGLFSLVLTLLHVMIPPVFLGLYVAGVGAAWWTALRREDVTSRARAWRAEIAQRRWSYLLAGAVLLAFLAIRIGYSPLFNLADQTPLRYWADGIEIADAGRIPEASLHWGRLIPPTVSKVVLNTVHAGASFVLGRGPLAPMGGLLLIVSVALVAAAFALGRELGLRRGAVLVPVLLFGNDLWGEGELTTDLVTYRAENWGRLVALAGILLAVRAIRRTGPVSRTDAVLAGVLLGTAAGTHLVPAAVAAAFVGAYAVAQLVIAPRSWRLVRPLAVIAGVAILLAASALLIPRGDVGFEGASGAEAYAELRAEIGDPDFDPTLFIAKGDIDPDAGGGTPVVLSPREVVSYFTATALGVPRLPGARWILPLAAIGVLALLLTRAGGDVRIPVVAAGLLGAMLLGVSFLFALRYDVFALSQFGPRRLFDYALIPTVLVGLAMVEVGLRAIRGSMVLGGRRIEVSRVAEAILVVGVAAVLLPASLAPRERLPLLRSAVSSLGWIRGNVPCEGRVLADRRTLATFEVMTRRAGVLEGMGPHLRPRVLARAVEEILAAERFLEDPEGGEGYLRQRGVAAVMVSAPEAALGGTHRIADPDLSGLDQAPFLRAASRTDAATIYKVVGFRPELARDLPDVRGIPGYRCPGDPG